MNRVLLALLATTVMGVATVAHADCGCTSPAISAPVTAYYAPSTTASVVTGSPMPTTTAYYAPTTTVAEPVVTTAYYAPAPVTTYYAPTPVTTYYAPTPVTTYYAPAPAAAYYSPTYYAPAYYGGPVYYRGLFGRVRVAY
jgi:hypothetical protein